MWMENGAPSGLGKSDCEGGDMLLAPRPLLCRSSLCKLPRPSSPPPSLQAHMPGSVPPVAFRASFFHLSVTHISLPHQKYQRTIQRRTRNTDPPYTAGCLYRHMDWNPTSACVRVSFFRGHAPAYTSQLHRLSILLLLQLAHSAVITRQSFLGRLSS